ncbi:hypothetical protein AB4082_07765 [Vibrio cyclitrophicus]
MADIATISAVLSSVKTASDIAKLIKDSNSTLEAAEFKLHIAELLSSLADVKVELTDLQDELRAKDRKIEELTSKLQQKQNLTFDGFLYWAEFDNTPFCTRCVEGIQQHYHLFYIEEGMLDNQYVSTQWRCRVCDSSYLL